MAAPTDVPPSQPRISTFEEFMKVHELLLTASGIPEHLHHQLFEKLIHETFDGGEFFTVEACEGGRQRRLVLTGGQLEKESLLFLVDHAWTFRLPDALKQLSEVPGLADRMAALMCVTDDSGDVEQATDACREDEERGSAWEILEREVERVRERGSDTPVWLELEELGIDDEALCSMKLSEKFPNLVALNLWGNNLCNAEAVIQEITKCKHLKALWLNENPVNLNHSTDDALLKELPALEILNSKFTSSYGLWAFGFVGGIYGIDNPGVSSEFAGSLDAINYLDLSDRLIHKFHSELLSPSVLPSLSHLNIHENPFEEDTAENLLFLLERFGNLQKLEVDIPGPLGNSAISILESLPHLTSLNGVSRSYVLENKKHVIDSLLRHRLPEWSTNQSLPERVVGAMWLFLMTYRLADEEKIDETPAWYVMDELGSSLRHSDEPNFQIAPFLFMPDGRLASSISFSVLWPTRLVENGEECTRDFLFGIGEDRQRSSRLTAWFHTPENYFVQEFNKYNRRLLDSKTLTISAQSSVVENALANRKTLFVYTDLPQVEENLKRAEFTLTNNWNDADIIWTSQQIDEEVRAAVGLKDTQFINQFPFEACIVMKHHLADTIHKALGSPEWLQPTYNLETDLPALIGEYYVRNRNGLDNHWILKPWNMARTIDTTVTSKLSAIIRLMETGPKICQKYIERPALFKGKKFDLRYIVLVQSMNPVKIFLSDVFWVRLANNLYSLEESSLFEYETHFTVMNYIGKLNHMHTPDFVRQFEEEHQVNWLDIHSRICHMIRAVFDSAAAVHPEMHNPASRAMYGVDVMLDTCFQPKLLEVTYCPDCARACKYDTQAIVGNGELLKANEFFNNVFGCLFLGELNHVAPL